LKETKRSTEGAEKDKSKIKKLTKEFAKI